MTGPFKKALRKFWVIANQVNMENDHNPPVTLQISHQDQGVQNMEASLITMRTLRISIMIFMITIKAQF